MIPDKSLAGQQLEDRDYTARIRFANWFFQNIQTDPSCLHQVFHFEECVVHVEGKVKKHKFRIWGAENTHERREIGSNEET